MTNKLSFHPAHEGEGGFSHGAVELVARALAVELASAVEAKVATSAVGVGGGAGAAVGLAEEGAAAALASEALLTATPDLADVEAVCVLGDQESANECFEPVRDIGVSEARRNVSERIDGTAKDLQQARVGRHAPSPGNEGNRRASAAPTFFLFRNRNSKARRVPLTAVSLI